MAQETHVALLGTVVLLLDDEAEAIGTQLLRLCQTLDPLAQVRLRLLRVSREQGELKAMTFTAEQRQLVAVEAQHAAGSGSGGAPVSVISGPLSDPNATQAGPSSALRVSYGLAQPFEVALRGAIQEALRNGGTGPLGERGYALVPNELAVHIVGRINSPLLPDVALHAHDVTHTISAQTDAKRFALLLAASPIGEPERAASPTARTSRLLSTPNSTAPWQDQATRQPWRDLLSWANGDPPLHYVFMFEAWDESGRFHERPHLHYAVAESLFALFATGMLNQPQMKDVLDLSTAALEDQMSLTRVGSIGTSLITSPIQGMIDYLANRLAADLLLRRGLLGQEGGVAAPDLRASLPEQTRQDAERWLTGTWQTRLLPDLYPLPRRLPARQMPNGKRGTWHPLALSTATPSPEPLLYRWDRGHLPLDDEQFWNLAVQHEYETTVDMQTWQRKTQAAYEALAREMQQQFASAVQARAQAPEGIERAGEFTMTVRRLLSAERDRLQQEQIEQERQLDAHYRQFEELVRHHHHNNGIPTRPNPPDHNDVPLMPRNLEALAHEVLDRKADRVPLPGTMLTVALVMALFGALAVNVVPNIPGFIHWPAAAQQFFVGPNRHWFGALAGLVLYALGSLSSLVRFIDFRRWQRRFAGERLLLRMAQAKTTEREQQMRVIDAMLGDLDRERNLLQDWEEEIVAEAEALAQRASYLAADYTALPTLSRDVFVADGKIWEGSNPEALYLQVRQSLPEQKLILDFLQYVQAHAGGVPNAVTDRRLAGLALDFMYQRLRASTADDPFTNWSPQVAQATLDRAVQAARVAMQPHPAGRPIGHFEGLMVTRAVDWLPKLAQERHMVVLPAPSTKWCFVARVLTRAQHPLVK